MPNKPDPDKIMLSVRMPRTIYEQLRKLATKQGKSMSEIVIELVSSQVINIPLTVEDYEKIAKQVREATARYNNR
ncbi:MAG: Arc family DNA-binding protein [Akkermansia sp.]